MLGKLVGIGNTAEIYEWEPDKVIKLFKPGYPESAVEKEYRNALAVKNFDFDKPGVYTRIVCEGRFGIIYGRLVGSTLLEWVIQSGKFEECGRILGEEHKKILRNKVDGVLKHKDILRNIIEKEISLKASVKGKLLESLNKLPDGDTLCHGDFHPGNILLHEDKRFIIDWMNICSGHAHSDMARTIYLIEMTPYPEGITDFQEFQRIRRLMTDAYLKELAIDRSIIEEWLPVIAAARLGEGVNSWETENILNFVQERL